MWIFILIVQQVLHLTQSIPLRLLQLIRTEKNSERQRKSVRKRPVSYTHLDVYKRQVYLENAQYRDIACIAALFIDGLEYSSNDEIADSAIKEEYLSFNKELNSKFDAAFLERVRTNNM